MQSAHRSCRLTLAQLTPPPLASSALSSDGTPASFSKQDQVLGLHGQDDPNRISLTRDA